MFPKTKVAGTADTADTATHHIDPPRGPSDAFEQAWLKYGQLLVNLHRLSDVSLTTLDMLARLHDELARFDEQIDSDGLIVTNSQGRSANPLLQYRARNERC